MGTMTRDGDGLEGTTHRWSVPATSGAREVVHELPVRRLHRNPWQGTCK